ncbi:MAG: dienelactone hydrolase family protein [Anaerolineales bacterium]|jgi:carboxymethylenebutenolidase
MAMETFKAGEIEREGYLVLPESGHGKGILFLHAWWGLTDVFKEVCDRLALEGFVVFAPDLHHGAILTTIQEAEDYVMSRPVPPVMETAKAGMRFLQNHPAVEGDKLSAVAFSMGASFAYDLDAEFPDAFDKIVLVYGGPVDLTSVHAKFQCHFGEDDFIDPIEYVHEMDMGDAEVFYYPDTNHWFFEPNQEGYYKPEEAELAYQRMVRFFKES